MRVLILALAALLSGCAAVTAEQCATMNWHQQGINDGFNGMVARSGYWLSQCREYDIGIDQSAYSQGWAQGNGQYCTPAQGYRHGSQGHSYQGVCQGPGLQAFLDSYQRGHQLFERNQYRQSLQNRQQELRRRMAALDRQLQTPYVPCTRQVAFSAPPARLQPSPAAPASKGVVGRLALEVAQKAKEQQGKPDKPGRPDQPGKPDKPGRPDQPGKPDKPGRPDQPGKPDKPGRPDQPGKPDKPGRPDQPGKPDKPGRPDQPGKPDKPGRPDQPGKPDKPGRPDQPGKPDKPGRPDQPGKPDKPSRPDQPGKPDKPGKPAKPAKPCQPQGLDPQARRELLWQRQQLSDELMHLDDLLLELL